MAAAAAVTGKLSDVRSLELAHVPTPGLGGAPASSLLSSLYEGAVGSAGPVIRESTAEAGGGGMPAFTNLKGVAAPLDIQNVDTDMIIPKE
jgi:3-isopropylmalate dehydratase